MVQNADFTELFSIDLEIQFQSRFIWGFSPPIGFFIPGFPKLQRFQNHHDQILYKLLPKLKKHLVVETIAFPPHSHVYILMSFDLIIRIISHVYVASPVFSFSLTRTRSRCPAAFTALNGSCSVLLTV